MTNFLNFFHTLRLLCLYILQKLANPILQCTIHSFKLILKYRLNRILRIECAK